MSLRIYIVDLHIVFSIKPTSCVVPPSSPVSPSELINRLITADPLSSTRSLSPLPSLDMLQLPPPNLSTIFSCFVAVSGDPLPQHRHTRPRVIAAEGSFFLGRSHRSNTLSRDRLSGSCIVDEDDHRCYSLSLYFSSFLCLGEDLFILVCITRNVEEFRRIAGNKLFSRCFVIIVIKGGFFFFNLQSTPIYLGWYGHFYFN